MEDIAPSTVKRAAFIGAKKTSTAMKMLDSKLSVTTVMCNVTIDPFVYVFYKPTLVNMYNESYGNTYI